MNSLVIILIIIALILVGLFLIRRDKRKTGGDEKAVHKQSGNITINIGILSWLIGGKSETFKNFEIKEGKVQIYLETVDNIRPEIIYFKDNTENIKPMNEIGQTKSNNKVWKFQIDTNDFDSYIFKQNDTYIYNGGYQVINDESWKSLMRFQNLFIIEDDDEYEESGDSIVDHALDTESDGQTDRYIREIYGKIFKTNQTSDLNTMANEIIKYLDQGAYPTKLSNLELQSMRNAGILSDKHIALKKIKKYQKAGGQQLFSLADI